MALILQDDGGMCNAPYQGEKWLRRTVCPESGLIEPVRLGHGFVMVGDEEAKCRPHTVNHMASLLYRMTYGGDYMAGVVVLLREDDEGNLVDLHGGDVRRFVGMLVELNRFYMDGRLGPAFEATGPHVEVREMTDADMERLFGVKGRKVE